MSDITSLSFSFLISKFKGGRCKVSSSSNIPFLNGRHTSPQVQQHPYFWMLYSFLGNCYHIKWMPIDYSGSFEFLLWLNMPINAKNHSVLLCSKNTPVDRTSENLLSVKCC